MRERRQLRRERRDRLGEVGAPERGDARQPTRDLVGLVAAGAMVGGAVAREVEARQRRADGGGVGGGHLGAGERPPRDPGEERHGSPRQRAKGSPAGVGRGGGVRTPRAAAWATMAASRRTSSSDFPSLTRRKRGATSVSTRTLVLTVPTAIGWCARAGGSPNAARNLLQVRGAKRSKLSHRNRAPPPPPPGSARTAPPRPRAEQYVE